MAMTAVLSLKGGVGKSTVVLGLAGAAWARDLRVLVIDLDPQANATVALDPPPFAFTVGDVLSDGRQGIAAEAIVPSGWGPCVDVLPSEEAVAHRNRPEGVDSSTRLRVTLTGVTDAYDLVLDCIIPERSAVQQAQGAGVPVQAWRSPGASEVIDAFDDLLDRILD